MLVNARFDATAWKNDNTPNAIGESD